MTHDQFYDAMIKKNTFELEYTTYLGNSTYLTLDQWLSMDGADTTFDWLNTNGDDHVSWAEYLDGMIELIDFTNQQVNGLYSVDNLNTAAYGSITLADDKYYFYDRDNDTYVNQTEYIIALTKQIEYKTMIETYGTSDIATSIAFLIFD